MPTRLPQRKSVRVSLSPASHLPSRPHTEWLSQQKTSLSAQHLTYQVGLILNGSVKKKRQAHQVVETIAERKIEASTTITTITMAITATAPAVDPPCLHEANIVKTTKVGIALRDQAKKELTLDTKFDAQPKNMKASLCELTEQAMDCCWETQSIRTFTVDALAMNLFEDDGKIPIAMMIIATEAARLLDVTDPGLCGTQGPKHLYKCLTQSVTSKVRDNLEPYTMSIKQDGPLFFKYLMLEVASNPSSEAEAQDI
jgi:hypothetical protein